MTKTSLHNSFLFEQAIASLPRRNENIAVMCDYNHLTSIPRWVRLTRWSPIGYQQSS
jgi:hypothetical protein